MAFPGGNSPRVWRHQGGEDAEEEDVSEPTGRLTQWDLEQRNKQQAEEIRRSLFSFVKHEAIEDH
jgi:hypothetical protein